MRLLIIGLLLFSPFFVFTQSEPDTATYQGLLSYYNEMFDEGELTEALRLSEKMIEVSKEEFGAESLAYINSLFEKGFTLKNLGSFNNAKTTLQEAKALAEKHSFNETDTYGNVLLQIAECMHVLGEYEQATQLWEAAGNCFKDNPPKRMYALMGAGATYSQLENWELAEQVLQKCIRWSKAYLSNSETETESSGLADVELTLTVSTLNLGGLYYNINQIHKAVPRFEEALEYCENLYGPTSPVYATTKQNLAVCYKELEYFDRARKMFHEIYEDAVKEYGRYNIEAFGVLNNLVYCYSAMEGKLDTALKYALQLLEDCEQSEYKNHPEKASYLSTLANVYELMEQHAEALNRYKEAIAYMEEIHEEMPTKYYTMWGSIGRIYRKTGDYAACLKIMTDIKKNKREVVEKYSFILIDKALTHEILNEPENSFKEYQELEQILRQRFQRQLYFLSEKEQQKRVKGWGHYKNFVQSFDFRGHTGLSSSALALDINLTYNANSLNNRKQLLNTVRNSENPELHKNYEAWTKCIKELGSLQTGSLTQEKSYIDSLEMKARDLETLLARQSQDFEAARKVLSWEDIQTKLEEGEVYIDFGHFQYTDAYESPNDSVLYVAYLITKNQDLPQSIFLGTEKELANYRSLRNLYAFASKDTLYNLYKHFYQRLALHLEGIHTVHFSPSGLIHRMNIGATAVSESETMVDRFRLHQYISANDFYYEKKLPDYKSNDVIVFGGIQYESTDDLALEDTPKFQYRSDSETDLSVTYRAYRGDDWQYLEWTDKEATEVAKIVEKQNGEAIIFKGEAATEEAFKNIGKDTPSPRVLHLATHGYFFPNPDKVTNDTLLTGFESSKNPLIRSGLILAGANDAWTGRPREDDKEDGILTAYEISQMDLSNTELVVLSACETGLGDIDNNEGVMGLQRAFKMAGAKYVLMSLWNVKDKKTYEFMTSFYEEWLGGKEIPEAYQTAQSKMRQQYATPFNPKNWAGFILTQ